MSSLEKLKIFEGIAEKLKNKSVDPSYWKKEGLIIKKREEESKRISNSLKMNWCKRNQILN